jgi:tetratricopeptide (TPR) repeat protein
MIRSKSLLAALTVTSAFAIAQVAAAQAPASASPVQMAPAQTPDADALANAMRRLAGNPRDLDALITAGELSLKVGDASGAAALFKRAEQVDPMNGRVRAGMARILVTQERPGEALRYFDQAVGFGIDPRSFAGDRGLAYDLIGENARAQREYRLALKADDNDEIRRRYALSLGISGQQLKALEQIEPLTRRNDRAAWRARAFILAMTGDVPGATAIATRMMPGAMAQGLGPFFTRLPTLSATDKAFAVHFGETRPTPQRLADARLTPALPALAPDPDVRVQVAAASPVATVLSVRDRRKRRQEAARAAQLARAEQRTAAAAASPRPGFGAAGATPTDPVRAPVQVAAAAPPVAAPPAAAPVRTTPVTGTTQGFVRARVDPLQNATLADYARVNRYNREMEARLAQTTATPVASAPATPAAAAPVPAAPQTRLAAVPTQAPTGVGATIARPNPLPTTGATPTPPASVVAPVQVAAIAAPAAAPIAATPSAVPTTPGQSEDSILSRIVSGLAIPGAELGVGGPASADVAQVAPTPTPTPTPAPLASAPVATAASVSASPPRPVAPAAERPARVVASTIVRPAARRAEPVSEEAEPAPVVASRSARGRAAAEVTTEPETTRTSTRRGSRGKAAPVDVAQATTEEPTPTRARNGRRGAVRADEPATTRSGRRGATAKDDADQPADTRRRGRTQLAAKDDDAPAKGRGAKPAKDDAKTVKGEPPRIWVQVAGGANESDLPKAYSAVQAKTPALKGRAAYSTPLRATNRVVTGPFKTDAEARAFVNQLAKQGVSAFPFVSDKGQKMTKLPPK